MSRPRNSSVAFEKWRLKKRKSVNLKGLLCRRTLFRVLFIITAGTAIAIHAHIDSGICRTTMDWTITPGCFISDIIISMVQILSVVYGVQKDKLDGIYNALLMILYAVALDSMMNDLTPDDYGKFAWYRIIAESIASAVGFLLHFGEIIINWIISELEQELMHPRHVGRLPAESSSQTRTGPMRIARYTQTHDKYFKEDVRNHSLADKYNDASSTNYSNPIAEGNGTLASNYSIDDSVSWIRETVLVESFPWNNE